MVSIRSVKLGWRRGVVPVDFVGSIAYAVGNTASVRCKGMEAPMLGTGVVRGTVPLDT